MQPLASTSLAPCSPTRCRTTPSAATCDGSKGNRCWSRSTFWGSSCRLTADTRRAGTCPGRRERPVRLSGLQATAYTYRTKAEIFLGMAHAMMLDHGWERVATRIAGWLEATLSECEPAARGIA